LRSPEGTHRHYERCPNWGHSGRVVAGAAGTPSEIAAAARGLGLEGVVAERRDSVYEPGERSGAWRKLKLELSQEFVVGGYRPGFNSVDALLVGYYEGHRLHFAGKVTAGFVAHTRREIFKELQPLRAEACPFADLPTRGRTAGAAA
jgi:bifunctional non-homologous end joining protein LigD